MMNIGDEVQIRDDHGRWSGRGIFKGTPGRGLRAVEYSYYQYNMLHTTVGYFMTVNVKPIPKKKEIKRERQ